MSTPASPVSGFIDKYKALPGEALEDIEHPIDTLEGVLGLTPRPAPAPADTSWHDSMVRQANQTAVNADNARREEAARRAAVGQRFRQMTAARQNVGQ